MEESDELEVRKSFENLRLKEPPLGIHAGDIIFGGKQQQTRRRRRQYIAAALAIAAAAIPVGIAGLPASGTDLPPVSRTDLPTVSRTEPNATATAATPHPISPVRVYASSSSLDSTDDAGNPVTYAPENAVDGLEETAWRPVEGDGVGQTFTLGLGGTYSITSVGLLPGYAKIDSLTGHDRFLQNRRIEEVRWYFDDGSSVAQRFADDPSVQSVDVAVRTSTIRFEIVATRAPQGATGDVRNFAPVSEIAVQGTILWPDP